MAIIGITPDSERMAKRNLRHRRRYRCCALGTRQGGFLVVDNILDPRIENTDGVFGRVVSPTTSFLFAPRVNAIVRYTSNRQPGKALPYFLRLRRPNVFDLIRENNLFTDVRDQVLLLVQFDDELMKQRKKEGQETNEGKSDAITLLVDNIHSIPVSFHRKLMCCYL